MKYRGYVLFLICVLCTFSRIAVADDCSGARPDVTDDDIVIDARDGSFNGPTQYKVRQKTRVFLTNKNPFRYKYELRIAESLIVEDAIGRFFALAGISADPAPVTQPETDTSTTAAPHATVCDEIAKLAQRNKDIATVGSKLKKAIEDEITTYNDLTNEIKDELFDLRADGPTLCSKAKAVHAKIKASPPSKVPEEMLKQLETLIEEQEEALDPDALPDDCNLTTALKKEFKKGIKDAMAIAKWADAKIDALDERRKEVAKVAELIENTPPDAYWEVRPIGPHNQRTEAKISVTRTDLIVPEATAETIRPDVTVNFGAARRFFLSGGIAASSADVTRFKVVDGFVFDRDGNPVLEDGKHKFGKVVGLEEDSAGRVSPAVVLHGIIWQFPESFINGVGFSLGLGAAGSDDTILQFFAGPTLSFADDHLFVTLGALRGQETRLAGDFFEGAEVTDGTTLSTVERSSWTFGLGLTFRIP